MKVAVMCSWGEYRDTPIQQFKEIDLPEYDTYIIRDVTNTPTTDNDSIQYTHQDLIEHLKAPKEVSKKHYWNSFGNRNVIWFHAHLRMLNFYRLYPDYEYYWFFDDDVTMNNWELFFKQTDLSSVDFISYFIFKKPGVSDYTHIPEIDRNTTSGPVWFERFPGDQDNLPAYATNHFGSFFPCVRYSNDAMKLLLKLTLDGYCGYGEGFVPTVISANSMSMCSLHNPDNSSDLYNTGEIEILHKNIFVNWGWI